MMYSNYLRDPMKIPKKALKKTKRVNGRPRIYTPELLDKLSENLIDWVQAKMDTPEKLFLLGDWCFSVGFNMNCFQRYADQNKNFKCAYEWAKQWQEHQVAKGALMNVLNPRFAQFFLGCNHKWSTLEQPEHQEKKEKSRLQEVSEQLHALQKKIEEESQEGDE